MNDRLENGALAGLLVLTLVLVGFSLRTREPDPPTPSASGSTVVTTTPSPSSSRSSASTGGVVFLGDSFAEGKSATAPTKRWTAIVAASLGLKEVNLGHARTGYLRAGPQGSCGSEACPNFQNSVSEVVAAAPSTVIVTGGANDTTFSSREFSTGVAATLTALKKRLPSAKIYVTNPWWDLRPTPDSLTTQTAAVKDAAEAAGVVYLDTEQPVQDKPDLMISDGSDPNDAGHAALAAAVASAITASASG